MLRAIYGLNCESVKRTILGNLKSFGICLSPQAGAHFFRQIGK